MSWNDLSHGQEDGERFGVVTLIGAVATTDVVEAADAPTIDGAVDEAWDSATAVTTDLQVEGTPGASASVRYLWQGSTLYALAEVTDPELDDTASNPWEQDSVELFVDPTNEKNGPYTADDGQYRISATNALSFGGEASVADRLTSATQVVDGGYVVEASIDLGYAPEVGDLVGLDAQVNDAAGGVRGSVRTWADPTGRGYQSTARWGVGTFVEATEPAAVVPAVDVVQPTCETPGSITGVEVDGVARYVIKDWVDGKARGYVRAGEVDPGTYVVRAWPEEGVTLTPGEGWESIFQGRVQTVVTIDDLDCTAPTVTVKPGAHFTVGSDGVYSKVSFKLYDAGKIDRLTLNGKVKDLTDNRWPDLNFVAPGKFGAVEGENMLVVLDVAGNTTTVEFTLTD
ncbi:sugar-binding protein [Paraoerskovia sediminicola]|uniref:sugar-binding protein n=1 Tax=Paraoerskovia sediminicola TaxID=1138587 RepID=UPI002572E727|nr:sugar-binding protein [Paraoerskovia sediminicola]